MDNDNSKAVRTQKLNLMETPSKKTEIKTPRDFSTPKTHLDLSPIEIPDSVFSTTSANRHSEDDSEMNFVGFTRPSAKTSARKQRPQVIRNYDSDD